MSFVSHQQVGIPFLAAFKCADPITELVGENFSTILAVHPVEYHHPNSGARKDELVKIIFNGAKITPFTLCNQRHS